MAYSGEFLCLLGLIHEGRRWRDAVQDALDGASGDKGLIVRCLMIIFILIIEGSLIFFFQRASLHNKIVLLFINKLVKYILRLIYKKER